MMDGGSEGNQAGLGIGGINRGCLLLTPVAGIYVGSARKG